MYFFSRIICILLSLPCIRRRALPRRDRRLFPKGERNSGRRRVRKDQKRGKGCGEEEDDDIKPISVTVRFVKAGI